ncbi:MAG: ATP-binding protein, partial [Candidatus Aureabacteria bacterium]|nr:ATP-binding protein [Candidatus Auribacterota bacterium]
MKAINHNLEKHLISDLQKKMVFLSGPRQIGKTTLARKIMKILNGLYLLYDEPADREVILTRRFVDANYLCLDEFHKFDRWKAFLKGTYDKNQDHLRILITGSARLDIFQKSGDSLFGRYYLYHLHPLTLGELNSGKITIPDNPSIPHESLDGLDELFLFGGFPEPFMSHSVEEHRRWLRQRRQLLIQEEFRELTHIQLLSLVENLMLLLPERIGSLFSATSVSEDLHLSVPTVLNWMNIFEKLFIVYKILPYSTSINRSIRKAPKYYLWDWSQLTSESARFENMIASHLYKAVHYWNDLGLTETGLYFLRDRNSREVDFIMTRNNQPWFLAEVKLAEEKISSNLEYFSNQLKVPGF